MAAVSELQSRHHESETLYTEAEVAQYFRVSKRTISRWRGSQDLSYIRMPGGQVRIPEAAVADLVGRHSVPSRHKQPSPPRPKRRRSPRRKASPVSIRNLEADMNPAIGDPVVVGSTRT